METQENPNFLEAGRIDPSIPCVTERYFKAKVISHNEHCILVHSNRLCVVTIAPTHPILAGNLEIESINFESVGHKSRLTNKVSGKFKKGGQRLKEKSLICVVRTCDGQEHLIHSCISGTLIEVNERLIEEPSLLQLKPWSDGYIAVILPPFSSNKSMVKTV